MAVALRPAVAGDGAFLAEMLVAAVFWRPDGPTGSVREIMDQPALAHYLTGWPRPGDRGVIAEEGRPVGAAWLRLFPEHDPGFGFVDARTPELSIGVVRERRGLGVGSLLLGALIERARQDGLATVSLSVEPDNRARRLYERFGFETVGQFDGSLTMLLRL